MTEPTFDPAQALKLDLSRGQLTLEGSSGRVLVPFESFTELLTASAPEAIRALGGGMGTEIGRRIADRLGSAIERASTELYLEHLGGEFALTGLGCMTIERWGKALVLCVEGLKQADALERLAAALIEAAIQRSLSRDIAVIRLARVDGVSKFLVTGRHAREQIEAWLAAGLSYGDVLTKLHQGTGANDSRGSQS